MVLILDSSWQTLQVLGLFLYRVPRFLLQLLKTLKVFGKLGLIGIWDVGLFAINMVTPQLKKGSVVAPGKPGYQGIWPPFVKPSESDSRSPCPYLSALFVTFLISCMRIAAALRTCIYSLKSRTRLI